VRQEAHKQQTIPSVKFQCLIPTVDYYDIDFDDVEEFGDKIG